VEGWRLILHPSSRPPLVLSNALGTTSELWAPQLPVLAEHFRVVRYDHAPRRSVAVLGNDVVALANSLGLDRFSFCGLSLGGMVGMWFGVHAPDRVDRLVLACTSARFGTPREWRERAARVRAEGMTSVAYAALERWFTPEFRDRERFLEMQLATPPEDYALGLEAIGGFDFRDRLGEIAAPTLVIAGAEDCATTPADARFIAERIPDARLLVIEGAAHLANVERPDEFTAAVLEHLRG
jgi:3-oxoadipate enol-lactonase